MPLTSRGLLYDYAGAPKHLYEACGFCSKVILAVLGAEGCMIIKAYSFLFWLEISDEFYRVAFHRETCKESPR